MKRVALLIALIGASAIMMTTTSVQAATTENWHQSKLTISDYSSHMGNHYNYNKEGTHRVIFSVDAWNSNICKSNSSTSRFMVKVNRSATGIVYGSATVTTKVGTCINQSLGKQYAGEYWYDFLTNMSGGGCGFKSNMFNYGIDPKA